MLTKLKKTLLLVCLFAVLQVDAQSYLGLRGGINLATIGVANPSDDTGPIDGILGLNAAFFAEFGISKSFAIQPELNFLQKGWRIKFAFIGLQGDESIKFNYLEIPILFKYRFGNPNSINGYAIAGPSIGYTFSGKLINNLTNRSESLDFDDADEFNRTDISAVIGAGANYPVGPGSIVFDLRYHFALSNLFEVDETEENPEKVSNRGLNISLGYRIPIGGGNSDE